MGSGGPAGWGASSIGGHTCSRFQIAVASMKGTWMSEYLVVLQGATTTRVIPQSELYAGVMSSEFG